MNDGGVGVRDCFAGEGIDNRVTMIESAYG